MNCQEALDLLYDIIDQEASEIDEAEVRKHLDSCRDCSEIYRIESSVQKFLDVRIDKNSPAEKAESLRLKILDELDSIDRHEAKCSDKPSLRGPLLFVLSAAALVVLVGASFFTSDIVRHYKVYGPMERAHFASQLKNDLVDAVDNTIAATENKYGFRLNQTVDKFKLVGGQFEEVMGIEMAHFVYVDNGHRVSLFVAPSDKFEIPPDLQNHGVVEGDFEYYDHHCRGCRLVYVKSGSAVIITATEDRDTELLSFVPGHSLI